MSDPWMSPEAAMKYRPKDADPKFDITDYDRQIIGKPVRIDLPLELDQYQMRRIAEKLHAIAAEYEKAALRTDLQAREVICLLRGGLQDKRGDIREIAFTAREKGKRDY